MKKPRLRLIATILLLLSVTVMLQHSDNSLQVRVIQSMEQPSADARVLVIAPHNDDETLGTGALVHRLTASGAKVAVVVMTNGDGFSTAVRANYLDVFTQSKDFVRLGWERQQETSNALQLLGVQPDNTIFLGYPDGGLYSLWSAQHWENPYSSRFTRTSRSPYSNSYTSRATYSGSSLANDLSKIISSFQPTVVIYPHPNDSNSDHLATYNFTKYALTNLQSDAKQYLYLVHRGIWPLVLNFGKTTYLAPPRSLANRTEWHQLELSSEEIDLKRKAITKYRTQMRVMEPKLMAFCRRNELFATFADGELPIMDGAEQGLHYSRYLIQSDPTMDLFTPTLNGAGDLKALYGYRETASGDIHLFLETRAAASPELTYTVDMFAYDHAGKPARVRLSLHNGEVTLVNQLSPTSIATVPVMVTDSIVHFTLPGGSINQSQRLFLGCSSSLADERVDNMAWRVYDLPAAPGMLANK